jgi:hypothetical protein
MNSILIPGSGSVLLVSKIRQAGVIRKALALLFLSIFLIALYDLVHPSSSPTLSTGIVILCAGCIALYTVRLRTFPCPRSKKRAIIMLFAIGCVLRIGVVVLFPNRQVSDFQIFHELAITLYEGKGFAYNGTTGLSEDVALYLHKNTSGPVHTTFRMPGTPLIMAATYCLVGPHQVAAKLINAMLGAAIGICLLLLLWGSDPPKAFQAGFLWEIYPSTLFNTNLLGTEIHVTFGIVLAALFLKKAMTDGTGAPLLFSLAAGLTTGYTCLIRPSTQLIVCITTVAVWFVWQRTRLPDRSLWKKAARLAGVLMLGIALPLAIWGFRNYRSFGVLEWQSSEIGFNFMTMTQNIISPEKEHSIDSLIIALYRSQNEFEIAALGKEIGMRRLAMAATQPIFVKTLILNFMKAWKHDRDGLHWCLEFPKSVDSPEKVRGELNAWKYKALQRLVETCYLALLFLTFFGAIKMQTRDMRNPGVMMMLLYFLGTCVLLCIFQGQPRYHFPFVPLFCVFAANAIGPLRRDRV